MAEHMRAKGHPVVGLGDRIDRVCRYVDYLECALLTVVSEHNGCGERHRCVGQSMSNPNCECAKEARKYLPKEFRG